MTSDIATPLAERDCLCPAVTVVLVVLTLVGWWVGVVGGGAGAGNSGGWCGRWRVVWRGGAGGWEVREEVVVVVKGGR